MRTNTDQARIIRTGLALLALGLGLAVLAPATTLGATRRTPDPLGAEAFLAAQRAGFGPAAAAASLAARAQARAADLRRRSSTAGAIRAGLSGAWQGLGPGPVTGSPYGGASSGRVDAVAVIPGGPHAGEIFVGTAGGGVWSSSDGGASWITHTDQVTSGLAIGALAIDPVNPSIIYAGTGEADDCGDCFYGGGVLKSTDGGLTWSVENPGGMFTGIDFASLAVDPRNDSRLYAATSAGFYVSTDGGASWAHPTGSGDVVDPASAVALDPATNPTTVYIATEDTGLQKSTDGAADFATLAGGLPAGANISSAAIAVGTPSGTYPSADRTLYAAVALLGATDPNGGALSLYKSTDAGTTWTPLSMPAYSNQAYAYGTGSADQAGYDNALAVDPGNPAHVIAGAISTLESTDGGATWNDLNGQSFFGAGDNALHPDLHSAAFTPTGHVVLGTDGGVFAYDPSDPGPSGMSNLNTNLDTALLYEDLGISGDGTAVLAGMQDNGTVLYGGAPGWPDVLSGNGGYSAINPFDSDQQFAESDGYLSETTDAWASESVDITPPGEPDDAANFVPPLVVLANPAQTDAPAVYYGGGDLWLTRDAADPAPTWTQLTSVGTGVSAIAASPSDPSVMYVGFDDGTLEVSTDATAPTPTFTAISSPVGEWITHIAVSPADPGDIALTFSSSNTHTYAVPPMVETGAVSLTGTPSAAFTDVTGNLPDGVASNADVFDGTALVVATDVGVFATSSSDLNGASTSWSAVGGGLPNVQVLGLTLDAAGNLYAATHGRGVWELASGAPAAPVAGGPPAITGESVTGQTLREVHAIWSGNPTAYAYQWLRCAGGACSPIPGATAAMFTLTAADLGASLVVRETASGAGGAGVPVTSAPTATVASPPAVVSPPPSTSPPPPVGTPRPTAAPHPQAPTAAQIRTALQRALAPHSVPRIKRLLAQGWSFRLSAPSAGRLSVLWTARAPHSRHIVQVAVLHVTLRRAGGVQLKLTLTQAGRHLIASLAKLSVTATSELKPSAGSAASIHQFLTLRR